MLESSIKQSIIENPYVTEIRHLSVDQAAFDLLCASLSKLADLWKTKDLIDKELVAELYAVVIVTLNTERTLRSYGDAKAEKVAEMGQDLDRLVLECLRS